MKREFKAHPFMILNYMKPFLFVLVIPLLKGIVQYILYKRATGILATEAAALAGILLICFLKCRSFSIVCGKGGVKITSGIFIKQISYISAARLSSVQTVQNPLDAVLGAVTYCVNTEAGKKGDTDFKFKLSVKDSKKASELLYGKSNYTAVRFSALKVAVMAATSSSAVTGLIIGVPIINKAGKLLGIALNNILFDEINTVSGQVKSPFPPIVNAITLIFLLSYTFSFIYSFLKYINFKLFLEKDKIEVRSGFFIRNRTSFKKESVNDVTIDQTPLMRIFRRYAMKVSVGGYGNSKSETAVLVPSERRGIIKRQFQAYFPFLISDGKLLHTDRTRRTRNRFLFFPMIYIICATAAAAVPAVIFADFTRLILFLYLVLAAVIAYYAYLCIFDYRFGKLRLGRNIYAQGIKRFKTYEFYCPFENVGEIKVIRTLPDRKHGTCNVSVAIRSESADSVTVRHLNYKTVKTYIAESYGIEV